MLSYPLYFLNKFYWLLGRLMRKWRKGPQAVLLTLSGDYPQIPGPPPNRFVAHFRPPRISLMQLGEQFRQVARDSGVETVVLHLRSLVMPYAKLDVLRAYVLELQEAGKRVVTWSYQYNLGSYYLASAADEILLLPSGMIGPLGIANEYIYLGDALQKIGVQAEFIQISPYKSAGDVFSRSAMTDEVREMGNWLADASWKEILAAVADGRGLDQVDVEAFFDQTPCTDLEAEEAGFVDGLITEEDLPEYLGSKDKPAKLTIWQTALSQILQRPPRKPGKYIALMGIEGIIIDGNSQQPPVDPPVPIPFGYDTRAGDRSITKIARRVLADKQSAALVIYIDSRGGSVTASESIHAALSKVAAKKPVIVVLGPVAASGGYYVATPGQKIFSQPSTVTGSIGVLFGKFRLEGLLKNLLINREIISRGESALFFDPEKPWTEEQRGRIWKHIQRAYGIFLDRVADSRSMGVESVDSIAGGRVWTGRQALELGLVDELSGLDQALKQAGELTELDHDAAVRVFYPKRDPIMPLADPAGLIRYFVNGFKLQNERVICLLPWVNRQRF